MSRFDALMVLWRSPDDGTRFRIGTLRRVVEGFSFDFGEEVDAAAKRGFPGLVEFPERRTYRSRYLFPTFAQRVPSPRRPDFASMMQDWGVQRADDPLEILARSGGLLLTDRLELAEARPAEDPLEEPLEFRIAGMRFYAGAVDRVEAGQALKLEHEPNNVHDPNATFVLTIEGAKLGHVPRQHAGLVARHLAAGHPLAVRAVRRLRLPDDERWIASVRRTG